MHASGEIGADGASTPLLQEQGARERPHRSPAGANLLLLLSTLTAAASPPCTPRAPLDPVTATQPEPCFTVAAEVMGRLRLDIPDDGISRHADLSRLRLQTTLEQGPASLRIAATPTRSSSAAGTPGIDGEAFVAKLQIAEARLDAPHLGLAVAGGIVDDPWTITGQGPYGLRGVTPVLATESKAFARSDIGAWASWRGLDQRLLVSTALLTGEGADLREQNNGKNTTLQVTGFPLLESDRHVAVTLMGRAGSRGPDAEQDHRVGIQSRLVTPELAAGIEAIRAWGLGGDGSQELIGGSVWTRTGPALPAVAWARLDHWRLDSSSASATTKASLGGGPRLGTGNAVAGPGFVALAWQGEFYGADTAIGDGTATSHHMLQLVIGTQLQAAFTAGA